MGLFEMGVSNLISVRLVSCKRLDYLCPLDIVVGVALSLCYVFQLQPGPFLFPFCVTLASFLMIHADEVV